MVSRFTPVGSMSRKMRRPRHTFQVRHRPWQIQPFMIAPVLPGETLKNLLMQSRAVTDPLKNPLVGWWLEYYFFYVKHRDLVDRDLITAMHLDLSTDISSLKEADRAFTYHAGSQIDWTYKCLRRIVEEYFRNDGEDWLTAGSLDGVPLASVGDQAWFSSAVNEADWDNPDIELTAAGSAFGTAVWTSEVEAAMRQYMMLSQQQVMSNMSFEDYLRTFGVKAPPAESHRPELIRYVREWQYPSNTVDPATGTPSSAVSWAVAERADKDRFFTEPGFIVGVTCARPKIYFKAQEGAAVALLDNALTWLPATLLADSRASIKAVTSATNSPLPGITDANGYIVDVKDIFLHGDQFINFALTSADANLIALPTAALLQRYAVSADADGLFANAAPKNLTRQDGVVSLSIAGRQSETTPALSEGVIR